MGVRRFVPDRFVFEVSVYRVAVGVLGLGFQDFGFGDELIHHDHHHCYISPVRTIKHQCWCDSPMIIIIIKVGPWLATEQQQHHDDADQPVISLLIHKSFLTIVVVGVG